MSRREHTGTNLFLVWGYPTLIALLIQFAAKILRDADWYQWLWAAIPLVGAPLMLYFMNKDYARTHNRTIEQDIALQLWLFIAAACAIGGFATGYAGIYQHCYCTFESLLISLGCFMTGAISRATSMKRCGILGAALAFTCPFLQGHLWPWQMLVTAIVVVITLIIPGHLTRQAVNV